MSKQSDFSVELKIRLNDTSADAYLAIFDKYVLITEKSVTILFEEGLTKEEARKSIMYELVKGFEDLMDESVSDERIRRLET